MAVWSSINMSYGLANKRLDAERYKPQYLKNEKFLSSIKFEYLKKYISDISGGATPKGAKYPNNGIRFVRVQNIRDNFFDLSDVVYIDETVHNGQLFRSQIQESDVLLTITGVSYGNSSTAYKEMLPANINQHSVRIALKSGLLPEVLSTFFCCKYGRLQSDSKVTGDTRPALTYPEIGNYIIPIFDMDNQVEIQRLVKESLQQRLLSHSLYHQAEELLAKELQLDQLQLPNKKWYTTRYCEVVGNGRCDGEYYQPKYKQIEMHIKAYKKGYSMIKELFYENKSVSTLSKDKYKYIEIGDINTSDGTYAYNTIKKRDLPASAKIELSQGDVLISTVRPYRGAVSIIYGSFSDLIGSSAFTVVREKNGYKKEVLQVLLRLDCYKELLMKWNVGTSYPIIKNNDVMNLVIPMIPENIQIKISELVQQSFFAKQKSGLLLTQAKYYVEKLIEQEANKNK